MKTRFGNSPVHLLGIFVLGATVAGCTMNVRPFGSTSAAEPEPEPVVTEEDVRGIWSGGTIDLQGKPANEGLPVRLILGSPAFLEVEGGRWIELTRDGREGESFVFSVPPGTVIGEGEIFAGGFRGLRITRLVAEPRPRRGFSNREDPGPIYDMRLWVERERGSRRMAQLDRSRPWKDLRGVKSQFAFLFAYENWRTRVGGAPFDEDRFRKVVERLRSDGWRCAEHETLTVSPMRPATHLFEQRRSAQLYLIRAEEGADRLEVLVASRTGSKNPLDNSMSALVLKAPHRYFDLDYPVISVEPRKVYRPRPEFQFRLLSDDPDSARDGERVRVDIVRFDHRGSASGDHACGTGTWR